MRTIALIAAAIFTGSLAMAADVENKNDTTKDTSKNPITGTVTETTKHKKKMKGAHGKSEVEVTEKKKIHKDGKVETTTEVESKKETETK